MTELEVELILRLNLNLLTELFYRSASLFLPLNALYENKGSIVITNTMFLYEVILLEITIKLLQFTITEKLHIVFQAQAVAVFVN